MVQELNVTSEQAAGYVLAFLLASATVLYDCHVSIQGRLKRVPSAIYRNPAALILACICGAIASVAFHFTDGNGSTLVDSVLGLKQPNALVRGLCVGLTVLVLIRSKLSSFQGAEIGGELAYNAGRVRVMQSVNGRWRAFKSRFNAKNLDGALGMVGFEDLLFAQLREALKIEPEEYRNFVEGQIRNALQSKPSIPFDRNAPAWEAYYRTLINLALDYAGADVFDGWFDVK